MVLLIMTAMGTFLGLIAGASYMAMQQQCMMNPSMCNKTVHYMMNDKGPWHSMKNGNQKQGMEVQTMHGRVRGTQWKSHMMGEMFHAFLGIPYAEIPMRWEDSRPYPMWEGVREATMYGPKCYQYDRKTWEIMGSEDCLFLNVFTPMMDMNRLLPVMVWIDSTMGYQHGSGDMVNPKNFMNEHVVLVTFNSRHASMGYLNTEDGEVQGNMGLKDQVQAMMWVKQNIRNFGGDPDKVTIFGQDSGGASVHLHMLSPMSKDMFQRAISQSGTAHCPWAMQRNAAWKAKMLAQHTGCGDLPTTKGMVDCMRQKSGWEIMEAEKKLKMPNWNGEPYVMFGPTVEKYTDKSSPFLPDSPQNLISGGHSMKVPWMVGMNEEEGRYFASKIMSDEHMMNMANTEWYRVAPVSFMFDDPKYSQGAKDEMSGKLKKYYFGNMPIGMDNWMNYTDMYSDRYYASGIMGSMKMHSKMMQHVYPYMFKFRGDSSYTMDRMMNKISRKMAASHYDELYYLFNWGWAPEWKKGSMVMEFSHKMVKLWTSFAEMGMPTKTWGSMMEWKPMMATDPMINWYMIDHDTMAMMDDPWKARMDFWMSLGLMDDDNMVK